MTYFLLHKLVSAPRSPSSASSSKSIESDLNAPTDGIEAEYETEDDKFCDRLYRDGIVDADFKAIVHDCVKIPDLEQVSIQNVCGQLEAPCVLVGKLENKPTGYKTHRFTLVGLFAYLRGNLPICDIQIVGSAVPWLIPTYPTQIPGINEHWNPALQAQFAKVPNDIDLRVYLAYGGKGALEHALQLILTFIAFQIDDPRLSLEQRIAIVKQQFLEKKHLFSECDSEGNLLMEYLTIGIAPEGMPPIDILVVNKLSRLHLWQQDAMAISVGGLVCAFLGSPQEWKNRSDLHRMCRMIFPDGSRMNQVIIEKTSKIARLDSFEGIDIFSVLPLLLSAYLKGQRIVDSQNDMERELLNRFVEASNSYKSNDNNSKNWVSKVVDRADVIGSSKKYIYILAKGILRAVAAHQKSRPEAYVGMALVACRILREFIESGDAVLLWQEISRLQTEESRFEVAQGFFGDVKQLIDGDPQLLLCILAWIELYTFLNLYRSSDHNNESRSVTIRHKNNRFVQWIDSHLYLLLPLDPSGSCCRYIQAFEALDAEQMEKILHFSNKYKRVESLNKERALWPNVNRTFFDEAVHLPGSLARIVCDVHFVQKVFPEFSWFEEHWHRLLGVYEAFKDRLQIVRQLQVVYGKPEEVPFLSMLEKCLSSPKNEEISIETLRAHIVFTMQSERQVLRDYDTWQELRHKMDDARRGAFDKVCFERLIVFRSDKAAEMLTVMVGDTMGLKSLDGLLKSVLISTRNTAEHKRSWVRLNGLLEKIVALKGVKALSLTKDNDKLLITLLEEMLKNQCLDKDFIGLVLKLIDPKNISHGECARYLGPFIDKGDYAGALRIWNACDQLKIWKSGSDDSIGTATVRLVLHLEFSSEHINLYKYFQKVDMASSFPGILELIAVYLEKLERCSEPWTLEHANCLMFILRSPIISDFIMRKKDGDYFEKIFRRIVFAETLNATKANFLNNKNGLDYIDAIFCVGYLRNSSHDQVKKKILERLEEPVRLLVQYSFDTQAIELVQLGVFQKKRLFTKPQDAHLLYHVIVQSKDFVTFAIYKNLLENIGEERFKLLEVEVMKWMESAPQSSWDSLFTSSVVKGEMNEHLYKNLWSYLCKMMMKGGCLQQERCDLLKRAILFIASYDRRKLQELFDHVEKLCEIHGKTSKEQLVSLLRTLFDKVVLQHGSVTLENMEKLWKQRIALENHLDIKFGETDEWKDIDMELAVISAQHLQFEHHEQTLPLLLLRPPSKETTIVICKVMTSQSNEAAGHVLQYLEMSPPVECDLISLLRHPQFLQIVSIDIPKTVCLLQSLFENAQKKNHPDYSLELISNALILIEKSQNSRQKEFWLSKLSGMLTPGPEIHKKLSELAQRNYGAIYAHVIAKGGHNAALYPLLVHKIADEPLTSFSSDEAENYCQALVEVIPTLTSAKNRTPFIQTIEKCLHAKLLQNAKMQTLGLLQMSLLKMYVDFGMVQDADRLIAHITSQTAHPEFFGELRSSQILESFLRRFDKQWNPIFNTLMDVVKEHPRLQSFVLIRMKGLIELQNNVDSSPTVKIALFFHYSEYLKARAGKEYYREQLLQFIKCSEKDLAPYIEQLFNECFNLIKIPEESWEKLFSVLLECNNPNTYESVVCKSLSYVIAHYNDPGLYEDCLTLLFTTLYYFPMVAKKDVLTSLLTPGFIEKLLESETMHPILPFSCCRLLLQCFVTSLPNVLEGSLKERWDEIGPQMINYLDLRQKISCPNVPKNENLESPTDEMFLFLFFMQMLQTGRWGSEVDFNDQVMTLLILLGRSVSTQEARDLYNKFPMLIVNLPEHRTKFF